MKLYPNLAEAVFEILKEIFQNNRYADKAIEYSFKQNKQWGARDRKFIAENVYESVRWWKLLWALTGDQASFSGKEMWKMISALWLLQNKEGLLDQLAFKIDKQELLNRYKENLHIRHINESIPEWLDNIGQKELGDLWGKELSALNKQAEVILRVNTLKTTKEELSELLRRENIETTYIDQYPDALKLINRQNIFKTREFSNGFFEVQDASSQKVAPFSDVEAGMMVIDACAGAGGKTLHLAALMKNKGRIIAMDIEQRKINELRKRATRAGADNIETKIIDSGKVIKRYHKMADRLIIDVPCSGLGVLKRNPDAKWKLTEDKINELRNKQKEILDNYSHMVKPGGKIIYATCSILPSENTTQVSGFLERHPNFSLEEEKKIFASESGFDGFYMARMIRKS